AAEEALENADEETPFEIMRFNGLPTVTFDVAYNPETAWLIDVEAANFRFADEDGEAGDGLAYIFREGELVGISSNGVYQLRNIDPGDYEFTVSLHNHDGSIFTVNGEPLSVTREVSIQ
ncbi:MAG: hypothetical protein AAF125_14050, partial [Chloroflexota bacterium]